MVLVEVRVQESVVRQSMEKVESHIFTQHQENEGTQELPRSREILDWEGVPSLEIIQVEVEIYDDSNWNHIVKEDQQTASLHQTNPFLSVRLPRPGLMVDFVLLQERGLEMINQIHCEVTDEKPEQMPDL